MDPEFDQRTFPWASNDVSVSALNISLDPFSSEATGAAGIRPEGGASAAPDPASIAPQDGDDEERAGFRAFQAWCRTSGPIPPPQSLEAGSGADAPQSLEEGSGADAADAKVSPRAQRRGGTVIAPRAARRASNYFMFRRRTSQDEDAQGDAEGVRKYPEDSYSYMAIHGFASVFFYVGFSVWVLQVRDGHTDASTHTKSMPVHR